MTFRSRSSLVIAYAIAMALVESACVVYLQRALGLTPYRLLPLQSQDVVGSLGGIELGREAATLVMLATVGSLAGRRWADRLAWTAVAFGVWDIFYYAWLWVFLGWPSGPFDWDVLFLIPVPWVGPVWAPVVVSVGLVAFGLLTARAVSRGQILSVRSWETALGAVGGAVVILSFTLQAPTLLNGDIPAWFPWPVFVAGMGMAVGAAVSVLRRSTIPAGPRSSVD